MPSKDYQIVFRGRTSPEVDETTARENMARLFKTDVSRVEKLFNGQRQVLKKGLERDAADKYRAVLRKAGLIVSVVSVETERSAQRSMPAAAEPDAVTTDGPDAGTIVAAEQKPATAGNGQRASFAIDDPMDAGAGKKAVFKIEAEPGDVAVEAGAGTEGAAQTPSAKALPGDAAAASDPASDPASDDRGPAEGSSADLAPLGTVLAQPDPIAEVQFDLSDIELADDNAMVDESPKPAPLEIDTSNLSTAETFEELEDSLRPATPEIDVSSLAVASDNQPVDATPPPAPAHIDTGDLSASDAFDALDVSPAAPAPAIDTDHLTLDPDS